MQPILTDTLLSPKTVGRLSLYRRLLAELHGQGNLHVFSHELAAMTGGTGAQVRRDMMAVGYTGSPNKGYAVTELLTSVSEFLDARSTEKAAVVGVGNLGRALIAYFTTRATNLNIVAAFDMDTAKVNRVIGGCRCFPMEQFPEQIRDEGIEVAVLAVPAQEAQGVAALAYAHGVRGIVNFAPVHLQLPENTYVEQIDLTMALDKAAFFGHAMAQHKEVTR